MSRVQLALNVSDIDAAVEFYSKLFSARPAKRRPSYANFVIADPPLKLVLIQVADQMPGSLNHLGVEVDSSDEVVAAQGRLSAQCLPTAVEQQTTCCYAAQDKVWAHGPDGEPWEFYTVLGDAGLSSSEVLHWEAPGGVCCASQPRSAGAPMEGIECR